VPNEAVVHFEGKNYVFIQTEPLVFEMVAVQTGIVTKEVIEIRNYEALIGKKIVIKNAYTVLMALKNKEE
jgi:cobalt-zinc-cadmium efflux system membrane fusion protein